MTKPLVERDPAFPFGTEEKRTPSTPAWGPREAAKKPHFSSAGHRPGQRPFQRDTRPDPVASSKARAELEALFSGKSPEHETHSSFGPTKKIVQPMQGSSMPVAVTVKRRRMGPDEQPLAMESADEALVRLVQEGLSSQESATEERAGRVFLVQAPAKEQVQAPVEREEVDPYSELALVQEGKLPAHVKPVNEPIDLASVRARLNFMAPDQALAWLLLSDEQSIKPLSTQEAQQWIARLLKDIDDEQLHALRPVFHWISEPSAQILRYSDGQLRRAPSGPAANLPGGLGVWVSANQFLPAETPKRSANAQRINRISLAGLVMACNRQETLEWMVAGRLSPIRAAALLGCAPGFQNIGHEIGTINGHALALLAQSNHFFNWALQWQTALHQEQANKVQELTAALSLAIKVWSGSHGDISQSCAEMAVVMLQMGAQISESGLQAFAHQSKKFSHTVSTAVAWSRLCAQTFSIDRKGLAVQRVIDSARIMGYKLMPKAGEPQAMMPYAQANSFEAVGIFMRHGFPVDLSDAIGETVLSRARKSQAHRVVRMIESYLQGQAISREIEEDDRFSWEDQPVVEVAPAMQSLISEQTALEILIRSMKRASSEIRELDRWLGIAPAQNSPQEWVDRVECAA